MNGRFRTGRHVSERRVMQDAGRVQHYRDGGASAGIVDGAIAGSLLRVGALQVTGAVGRAVQVGRLLGRGLLGIDGGLQVTFTARGGGHVAGALLVVARAVQERAAGGREREA